MIPQSLYEIIIGKAGVRVCSLGAHTNRELLRIIMLESIAFMDIIMYFYLMRVDELVILNDGEAVEDFGQIKVSSQFHGNISLQCVGYYPSNVFGMEWISEEQGQEPVVLTEEDSDDYISVSYGVNSAYLFINNRIRSYRGTVRCRSVVADRKTTVVIADSKLEL